MSLALSGRVAVGPAATGAPVAPSGPKFRRLPRAARLFVGAVVVLGGAALALETPSTLLSQPWVFVFLLSAASLSALIKVDLPLSHHGTTLSLSFVFEFAALLTLGIQPAMIIAAVRSWMQCSLRVQQDNPLHRTAFSMAVAVVTARCAGEVFSALGGREITTATGFTGLETAIVGAATTYFVLNTLLVSAYVALTTHQILPRVWNETFLWSALSYFVGAGLAAIGLYVAVGPTAWLMPLLAGPLYLTYQAYRLYLERMEQQQRQVQDLSNLHLATLEGLALAINAKDSSSTSHIRRIQVQAAGLARALGMSDDEVQGVRTAALLHDIGKLAVPEHILSKPGPLTREEFQKVQAHPEVGAEIIAHVPFPYEVASLIRFHHERWDGKGYPSGLKGEQIPLGARILAVVDHFDGLVSDRPYRPAMTVDQALAELQREAGEAFDPRVVDCFVELYVELDAEAALQAEPARRLSFAPGGPPDAFAAEPAHGRNVFENIALAHREIYALYDIAQTMGTSLGVADTMALISSKLSTLVPFSSCALFLQDENTDVLRCRFASGVDAEALQQVTLSVGHGLVGWVVRNRKTLVNARPGAEFEAAGLAVQTRLQSALVCPLTFNDRVIGALAVYDEMPGRYTDDHRRLLDRIAEQAAAVVNNSILFEQTKKDALTDPLTSLPNIRFMYTHLERELARAERLGAQVSLLVMDLDGFKEINDLYGHHVGDKALREVSRVLRQGTRPYDMCVRYAGDEFVIALSGCGAAEAEQKMRELQQAIAEIPFEPRPGRPIQLGSSVGYAVFPADGESYETLLATADQRMYQDKADRKARAASTEPAEPAKGKRRSVFAKMPLQPSVNRTH